VTDPSSPLRIESDNYRPEGIVVTPRIGIRHAADRPARFLIDKNKFVSGSR
jgi:3-methyladenine DNA glycosylase Mpg